MDLLFNLCTWHGLAKLRMHTKSTIQSLKEATTALGNILRVFEAVTCDSFETCELPQEEAARGRRRAALSKKVSEQTSAVSGAQSLRVSLVKTKTKKFSLSTYKMHALGDYVSYIQLFGTTDNYSTQVVSAKS
jgi:hypothetical protein